MLIARDGGCTKPGCTVPAYGSQVHHAAKDWADDGLTNVEELGLACGPDNRMVGAGGWTTQMNEDHEVQWIPPAHLDTGQARVNDYHRPERLRPPRDEPIEEPAIRANDTPSDDVPPFENPPFDDEWLIGPPDYEPILNPHEPGGPEPNAA
jgi:hypothetical protein